MKEKFFQWIPRLLQVVSVNSGFISFVIKIVLKIKINNFIFFKKKKLIFYAENCKRKFDELDPDIEVLQPCIEKVASASTSKSSTSSSINRVGPSFDVDLSSKNDKILYKPFSINLGRSTIFELKEFRGSWYVGLSKFSTTTNEPKNRFNLPVEQLEILREACSIMLEHIGKKEKKKIK